MSRYRCEVCDYVYDESAGEPREGRFLLACESA